MSGKERLYVEKQRGSGISEEKWVKGNCFQIQHAVQQHNVCRCSRFPWSSDIKAFNLLWTQNFLQSSASSWNCAHLTILGFWPMVVHIIEGKNSSKNECNKKIIIIIVLNNLLTSFLKTDAYIYIKNNNLQSCNDCMNAKHVSPH